MDKMHVRIIIWQCGYELNDRISCERIRRPTSATMAEIITELTAPDGRDLIAMTSVCTALEADARTLGSHVLHNYHTQMLASATRWSHAPVRMNTSFNIY